MSAFLFTPQQLEDFIAYEKVRVRGEWNMFDDRARIETGLWINDYTFVMQHYTALKEAVTAKERT